jgi:hypothetical protein
MFWFAEGGRDGDCGQVIRSSLMLLSVIGIAIGICGSLAVWFGFDPPGPGGPGDRASIFVSLGISGVCGAVLLVCWATREGKDEGK